MQIAPTPVLSFRVEKRRKNVYFRNQGAVARVSSTCCPRNDSHGCSVETNECYRSQERCDSQMERIWLATGVFLRESWYLLESSEATSVMLIVDAR